MFPGWRHVFWDAAAAQELLREHYPALLPTWEAFGDVTRQSDAARYAILHRFGGFYLDLDVSCFRPAEDMLAGHDVVLQGTVADEPVANGVMASVPGHPLWAKAMQLIVQRYRADPGTYILHLTGPGLLHAALAELGVQPTHEDGASPLAGVHLLGSSSVRVHPLSTFYAPCWWNNATCHRHLALQQAAGTTSAQVAGYHRYAASWLKQGNPSGIFSEADAERAIAAVQGLPPARQN